jgi:transposase
VIPPRRPYATDLTDAEWQLLAPLIPAPKPGGRPPLHDRRELVNAIAYWLRAGCAWRLLPHDLPPWQTVYHYFRSWRQQGLWEQVHATLRTQERIRQGRAPTTSAAILTARASRPPSGGAARLRRRQAAQRPQAPPAGRHLRLVCKVLVTAADVGDRDGAAQLLRSPDRRRFPRLRHGWVDGGYRGSFLDYSVRRWGWWPKTRPSCGRERPIPCHNRGAGSALTFCPASRLRCQGVTFPATSSSGTHGPGRLVSLVSSAQTPAAAATALLAPAEPGVWPGTGAAHARVNANRERSSALD